MSSDGTFTPVHQLLGMPKPRALPRPEVKARPIIAADRATMVQPFPTLPART
jgi:hypothetical protein